MSVLIAGELASRSGARDSAPPVVTAAVVVTVSSGSSQSSCPTVRSARLRKTVNPWRVASIGVRPGGQLGKGEVPLGVADAAPRFVGVLPENRDVDARKPGTGLVEDDAANGRARGLGGRFGRGEPEANDRQ